jgi:tRNA/tmRNA/rRNA uracil-C5-methylase (TrmA/RlmC/RlmD family)
MNIEIHIEKMAFGGEGIGYLDGKTCFVKGALPGETAIAKILQDKKNFIKAEAIKILNTSPHRVEPRCQYIEACGGCQYQHVSYEEELRLKEAQVREAMVRELGIKGYLVQPIRASSKEYRYRHSVTAHRTQKDNAVSQALGFVGPDNKSKVAVEDCLLINESLAGVFASRFRLKKNVDKISFKLGNDGRVVTDQDDLFFRVTVGDETLITSSKGFFQNNLFVTEVLAKKVSEWVDDLAPNEFFDLFSGVGTFTFLSAKKIEKVICIEESLVSVQALRMNASEKKRPVEIIEGHVEKAFPIIFSKTKRENTLVFLDPPRHGLDRQFASFLGEQAGINGIIYVSCDLSTLTRDLKLIQTEGRFRIDEVAPFDMFPKTKHIETAVLLTAAAL